VVVGVMVLEGEVSKMEGMGWFETGYGVLRSLWMGFAGIGWSDGWRVLRILWAYGGAHCTYMFRPRPHLNAKVRSRNVSHALRTLELLILIRKTSRERIEQVIGLALNLSRVFVRICRSDVLVQSLYENATSTR
jgi:hypothetical protein